MITEEKELLNRYDITVEQKSVYTYKGNKYDKLQDAVNYAKLEADKGNTACQAS